MAIEKSLSENIKGDIVTADHPEYPAAIARWATNAARKAKVVVFVKDPEDVAAALKHARENNLPVAIRGGGHNAAGASSVSDGMVIDLSRYLNKVRVDPDNRRGYVGGGCVWKDVDTEAIKYGLATVGGTVNHTGVAGLALGGGYGWLSGKYGLATDNLRQATVVTANGQILTANETQNSDLFWAIRGGGCNFGVVTEFVFELYPQRATVFGGFLVFAPPALESIIKATKVWWPTAREKSGMCQILTVGPDGRTVVVLLLFFNGSEEEGREEFNEFYKLGPIIADMAKEIPFEELNGLQNDMSEHGKGQYLKGVSQKSPDYPSMKKIMDKMDGIAQKKFIPAVIYEYFPLHKVNSVPVHATAFRRETTPNVLLNFTWEGDKDRTDEARALAKDIIDDVVAGQVGLSNSEKFGYTNYDTDVAQIDVLSSAGDTDRSKMAFASNYPRLQKLKKQYDPENTFNRWFPITPA
ncbi:FAD binding domain-containing protein [Coprinopsis cinerea okayama7|uniref:FAD binding domain-containing protein n=1 Tax=Coprinopsis cinerea (strain Okayama-7 / 130 / ATCC MYA-4618 / FGSC 9003) TaxID=240176 RepID=A8NYD1_COPC7|nr:FAD binding domain-containing protein [Coprinopsis cinerea okayama7\|eukprot:XP_001837398.1 FAD binding domain-containing protein [Coprinopsis cinerea okayama7\